AYNNISTNGVSTIHGKNGLKGNAVYITGARATTRQKAVIIVEGPAVVELVVAAVEVEAVVASNQEMRRSLSKPTYQLMALPVWICDHVISWWLGIYVKIDSR
ncbi:hypothetical protein TorRG33x02_184670, partial [Trema orientale]